MEGASLYARSRKLRPGDEVLLELIFRPLAHLVVLAALPLRIPPLSLVIANALVGLAAAVALLSGDLVTGALLLQLKTVLDNADGQLARASGRVTAAGRYLDTESDLVVNAVVLASLGWVAGTPLLALAAFLALTLVLAVDFNYEGLYREARGRDVPSPAATGRLERALERVYGLVFAPQDRGIRAVDARRLARIVRGVEDAATVHRATLAYYDSVTATALSNLGLSTQLAALGACLVLGAPVVYLWIAVGQVALIPLLQLRRERRARRALAA